MAQKVKTRIKTSSKVEPKIYAYTTPGIPYHDGYIKIGYTEQDVEKRINQQTHTAGINAKREWDGEARYEDGETFHDTDFHAYLRKLGVKQPQDEGNKDFPEFDRNEWFHIDPEPSRDHFDDFRVNRGIVKSDITPIVPYSLRAEQADAIRQTIAYRNDHEEGEFLWNAKPRFGKTLSVYDFVQKISAKKVLIVTNRPAIANSWYDDYVKFLGVASGYFFVSEVDGIRGRLMVMSYEAYRKDVELRRNHPQAKNAKKMGLIYFASLQDLKGGISFGGMFDKRAEISRINWDVLVIDEAHEGVDTFKTDVAFDHITRNFTLHLSGTPFKALANEKFPQNAIFNWTYADEQRAKRDWNDADGENPYATLPKLNLFTYQMSEIVKDEIKQGIEINGETEEYAFDLNEFFAVKNERFVHDSSVDKFLDALTTQEKFPFSTPELRDELKHTFWLLNRVESARHLADKLKKHPVFKEYEIILAAGDGKLDDDDATKKSYDKVVEAVKKGGKTITLSVGQLTTGVTIPEWTGVLMLSNVKSPALYMQAAFRAQNPCLFRNGTESFRKENAYVFDFDPARTLVIFEQFANDLAQETASGGGDGETRKKNVLELLNFFPVIGEDENGEMVELDAEKVLSIPRKIKSQEVVRRGFMSDFLFQNISNIFRAPQEVMDILSKFTPVKEPKAKVTLDASAANAVQVDENGDVQVPDEQVIGKAKEIFGEKIFGENVEAEIQPAIDVIIDATRKAEKSEIEAGIEEVKKRLSETVVKPTVDAVKESYGNDLKPKEVEKIKRKLDSDAGIQVAKAAKEFDIETKKIEKEHEEALENKERDGKTTEQIEKETQKKRDEAEKSLKEAIKKVAINVVGESQTKAVKMAEKSKKEHEKDAIEGTVRDHLRGFSRTIPSFLMAYGDDGVTLITFDKVVPDDVFLEVTSITMDEFRFLRDGGDYVDTATGEKKHFNGCLFEPVVFDDSVKEFMRLRKALANYFDEKQVEDIFDYIPPQKTNQIFTPKKIVQKMVDMLEQENPGCFDMPDKTFIDLYMKSGLYITEIVKRLYRSEKLKKLYPGREERLRHIFEKQVYGLAPTEIIYKIATNFILGFADDVQIEKHNFRQADATPYAKEGKINELVDNLFGSGQ